MTIPLCDGALCLHAVRAALAVCFVFVTGVNALVRQLTSFIDTEMRVTQGLATLTVRQSGFGDLMSSEETDFLDGQCHTVCSCAGFGVSLLLACLCV